MRIEKDSMMYFFTLLPIEILLITIRYYNITKMPFQFFFISFPVELCYNNTNET